MSGRLGVGIGRGVRARLGRAQPDAGGDSHPRADSDTAAADADPGSDGHPRGDRRRGRVPDTGRANADTGPNSGSAHAHADTNADADPHPDAVPEPVRVSVGVGLRVGRALGGAQRGAG
jgi:hypothetical protein